MKRRLNLYGIMWTWPRLCRALNWPDFHQKNICDFKFCLKVCKTKVKKKTKVSIITATTIEYAHGDHDMPLHAECYYINRVLNMPQDLNADILNMAEFPICDCYKPFWIGQNMTWKNCEYISGWFGKWQSYEYARVKQHAKYTQYAWICLNLW